MDLLPSTDTTETESEEDEEGWQFEQDGQDDMNGWRFGNGEQENVTEWQFENDGDEETDWDALRASIIDLKSSAETTDLERESAAKMFGSIHESKLTNIVLAMLGLILMTYANLVLYNTGSRTVFVAPDLVTFAYVPPLLAMIGGVILYLAAFTLLISVGASWAPKLSRLGFIAPLVYGLVGILFLQNIFAESQVIERAMGGQTDGYVLQTEGAERLVHGNNPYSYDYAEEILAQVPGYFRTPVQLGLGPGDIKHAQNIVTHLDYPAMSAIWYLPSQALGISGAIQDIFAIMLLVGLLVGMTRREYRVLIPVFFLIDWNLIFFPSAYIPDMGWVFFVVLALFTFHYPRLTATCFALAASYRPQPIVIAPYLGIMAYKLYGIDYLKKWIPTGLAVTALVNLPFALWTGPVIYLKYITIPLRISIPPGGVGPAMFLKYINLPTDTILAMKPLFTIAVVVVWGGTLALTWRYYDRLGIGVLAFPGLVLWFHWRSLQNYMLWFPMLVTIGLFLGLPRRDPLAVLRRTVTPFRTGDFEKLPRLVAWIYAPLYQRVKNR